MDGFTGTHLRDPNRDEHPFWQWPGALDGQDVNASWNVRSPQLLERRPALFLIGHFSPVFARFFAVFSLFSPS